MRLPPLSYCRKVLCLAATGAACACGMPTPNDAAIGCAYDPQSSPACVGYEAGAPSMTEGGPAEAGESGAESGASGLGEPCTTSTDCSGLAADYCLVSPNAGFESFCTFTHCTASECGSDHACCDCSKSSVSLVSAFPPGVCVLPMTAAALPALGCTCVH